jgi:hypothetical protein
LKDPDSETAWAQAYASAALHAIIPVIAETVMLCGGTPIESGDFRDAVVFDIFEDVILESELPDCFLCHRVPSLYKTE